MKNDVELYNMDAEIGVLKLASQNSSKIEELAEMLKPEDFYKPAHQEIFRAIVDLYSQSQPTDIVAIDGWLRKAGLLDKIGGISVLSSLLLSSATMPAFMNDAKVIKEYSKRRQTIRLCQEAIDMSKDMTMEIDKVQEIHANALERLSDGQEGVESTLAEDMVTLLSKMALEDEIGLLTGFFDIDRIFRGFGKGDLVILAARPAVGKSALALNITSYICSHGGSVIFFALEMSKEQCQRRILMSQAGVSNADVQRAKLEPESKQSGEVWRKLQEAGDKIAQWKMRIADAGQRTAGQIAIACKAWKRKHGLDLGVIDYLQLMESVSTKNSSRAEEVSKTTRALKLLARELDVPILVLSQLNRAVESRQDKRPLMSDLRESGSIEQDADKIMLMYRDTDNDEDRKTDINIAKHRSGATGTIYLKSELEKFRFVDWKGFGQQVDNKQVEGVF